MLRGFYPELGANPKKDFSLWHSSYIQTYLERDVRTLKAISDLTQFQMFLKSVAARSAQLFKISDVSKDIGVSVNTIKAWLSVLETSYQIIILRPYYSNVNKRVVKTPKIYFTDVGTLCYLIGLKDIDHLAFGPMAGAVFETFIISEIFKRQSSYGIDPSIYFWRTSSGIEVDILVEVQGKLIPIEVKASSTPNIKMAKNIISLQKDLGKKISNGYIVNLRNKHFPITPKIKAIPFSNL
jgi:predicted AAA+ superfamily ATPase